MMNKKKKPDLLTTLAIVVALGVIGSSVAQGMFANNNPQDQIANVNSAITLPR